MKTCLYCIFLVSLSVAETVVSGVLRGSNRWTREESPYVLVADVKIPHDARLVIEPGVEILVEKPREIIPDIPPSRRRDSFTVSFIVEGALNARGTTDEPIRFRGRYMDDLYAHWGGVVLQSQRQGEVEISHAHIMNSIRGVHVRQGRPLLRNILFMKNTTGIFTENQAAPRLLQSLFTDNYVAAIRIRGSNPSIYNSILYDNRNIGVWADGVSDFVFEHNLVYKSGDRHFVGAPPGMGHCVTTNSRGDSTDTWGNIFSNPLFAGSVAEQRFLQERETEQAEEDITRSFPDELSFTEEFQEPTFRLSEYSPARSAGKKLAPSLLPQETRQILGSGMVPNILNSNGVLP
ncbi:right-handed parallel beta-helix repeat-containing protein [Chitinivibrio alkaliphilus]|nr:right-handed parallel beta-helix repeat-containing protein [Chitinivibrio alkaliphilus]